ncbi:hypothetical protein HWC06_gp73 [Gordonia phage Duffington]|uniref:Uncharacterized protein n=1 Tax=Gordonia phage Duffington TaxID=2507858 RepID=A0A410TCM6_9CAUD|nr:hypothetical protein HWC06_gp73 [Gordonia phage Duffington]QAU06778.1 hypothetical protein SEA_DUFFINGTON_73 [Gordonia phage Duffington]
MLEYFKEPLFILALVAILCFSYVFVVTHLYAKKYEEIERRRTRILVVAGLGMSCIFVMCTILMFFTKG